MVSIRTSALIADAKGSVGGNVFARNKAGLYVRARIKPLNPRSTRQQERRAYAAAAASHWAAITPQERADWQAYAVNTTWTNRLGDVINFGGEAAFVRLNALLPLHPVAIVEAAPTEYGHAGATVATITADPVTQTPILAEPSSGFAGDESDTWLFTFAAMPQPGSREMAPNRFRFLQGIAGNTGSPVSFPYTLNTWPWTYVAGQRITLAMVHVDVHNRVSVRTFAAVLAAT